MMLKLFARFLVISIAAISISSCAAKRGPGSGDTGSASTGSSIGTITSGSDSANGNNATTGLPSVGRGSFDRNADSAAAREAARLASLRAKRVIYFDYDRTDVSPADRDVIAAHAKYLLQNSSVQITLEGHADERGSREYNIALGQRRADAVEELFALYGLPASRIRVLSLGEEKPASFGHNETAWRLNRRVEIQY